MGLIARPVHYHLHHRAAFDPLPDWSSQTISVPRVSGVGSESRTFYSLKKDLDSLRRRGAAKGIVDAAVTSIGRSHFGRELWALKVGRGSTHKVLFVGCHHAREWISVEVPYLVAEYLVESYTDPPVTVQQKRIKHLLLNREVWFVPMANPDGHDYTITTNRGWRPNRRAYAVPAGSVVRPSGPVSWPAGTYTGVDINRNYATADWGTETFDGGDVKTSRNPADSGANSIWCGLAASGEAETAALDALIRAQRFRAAISYHSYGQLLLYPDAADAADTFVKWLGAGMQTLINASGNPYQLQRGGLLYATTGDLMDFHYERQPGRPVYTPEVRPTKARGQAGLGFSALPEAEIEPCFRENLAAALALINCAGHDSPAGPRHLDVSSAMPAAKCQFVRHCWEVFRGWVP